MTKNIALLFLSTFLIVSSYGAKLPATVNSPNQSIALKVSLDKQGCAHYEVTVDAEPFIASSLLGLEARNGVNLNSKFKPKEVKHRSYDSVWEQPWGENKVIRENYNELRVDLNSSSGAQVQLLFRVFDDGIGFRYEYNVPKADSVWITDEFTEFNFAQNGKSWTTPAHFDTYEQLYKELPINTLQSASTPATFRSEGGIYSSIHEAALYDFPEMVLIKRGKTGFKADLAPWPDGVKARTGGSAKTSWRTVQIGRKATDLINSSLILNLNEPCKLETTDWIEPMKFVGIWWGLHTGIESWSEGPRHGATTENTMKYIDFASANNIRGVLVEGWNKGWETWGGNQSFNFTEPYNDFDIKKIVAYAKSKNVELIGHHETGGNIVNYESQLEQAFRWSKEMGINSIKTGYAGGMTDGQMHQGQYGVRHFQKVIEMAAKYHITLNAHETIKDTGLRRTWPNMMSRECGRSMEWNAWSEGNPTNHYEMLAFTRGLSGPFDYSPGLFDILLESSKTSPNRVKWQAGDNGKSRANTTIAKQIANWVIIYSPLEMAADMIENYKSHPAFQFFRTFDADCDSSVALAGEPGEFVVVVRKAGDKYFLGASTNEQARSVKIDLDFLEQGRKYNAVIYADGAGADWKTNPTAYQIRNIVVDSSQSHLIEMACGGGQAITFVPIGGEGINTSRYVQ